MFFVSHDLSKPAARHIPIRSQPPTEHPAVLDQPDALLDGLPDPEHLNAEQRAGSMTRAAAITIDPDGIPGINPTPRAPP